MERADTGGVKEDNKYLPVLSQKHQKHPCTCSKTCNTHFMQLNAALVSYNTDLTLELAVLNGENNQLPRGTLIFG